MWSRATSVEGARPLFHVKWRKLYEQESSYALQTLFQYLVVSGKSNVIKNSAFRFSSTMTDIGKEINSESYAAFYDVFIC